MTKVASCLYPPSKAIFFCKASSNRAVSRIQTSNAGNRQPQDVYTGGADEHNMPILT
jgi:hypothetical protein